MSPTGGWRRETMGVVANEPYFTIRPQWLTVNVFRDEARIRAVPFDAIELEFGILWQDVQL